MYKFLWSINFGTAATNNLVQIFPSLACSMLAKTKSTTFWQWKEHPLTTEFVTKFPTTTTLVGISIKLLCWKVEWHEEQQANMDQNSKQFHGSNNLLFFFVFFIHLSNLLLITFSHSLCCSWTLYLVLWILGSQLLDIRFHNYSWIIHELFSLCFYVRYH